MWIYVRERVLHCIYISLCLSTASSLNVHTVRVCVCVCMWTLYASITPGTLVHCHALFHCQWPPYMAPLSSTLFLIQNKWSQDSTGRRWEGWREGFGGLTKKKKEEKESRALSPWPSIRSLEKKRERERKKRRSMGKFIFPSATINLWPKEIHNN